MSYRYVVTATIVSLSRSRDDIASGMLRLEATAGKTLVGPDGHSPFTTRRTTVAACRKHHRASAWRPELGDRVLIDGEFTDAGVLIDALAPDLAPDFPEPDLASIAATSLAEQAAGLGSATKLFRQDAGAPLRRIRGASTYLETDGGTSLPAVPHLDVDLRTGRMRAWSVCKEGRGVVASRLTPDLEDALAVLAGLADMPAPPTPVDHLTRRTAPQTKAVGGIEQRPKSQSRRYRPGSALEDALRKAGIEHDTFADSDFDVPFEVSPSPTPTASAEESDCPF